MLQNPLSIALQPRVITGQLFRNPYTAPATLVLKAFSVQLEFCTETDTQGAFPLQHHALLVGGTDIVFLPPIVDAVIEVPHIQKVVRHIVTGQYLTIMGNMSGVHMAHGHIVSEESASTERGVSYDFRFRCGDAQLRYFARPVSAAGETITQFN